MSKQISDMVKNNKIIGDFVEKNIYVSEMTT